MGSESSESQSGSTIPPQHSLGPWVYDPEHGEVVSFAVSGRYIVAETVTRRNGPTIAMVPDLLAFIAKVAQQLHNDPIRAERELADEARGLIARAMGREP